jgi:hypothetical protein
LVEHDLRRWLSTHHGAIALFEVLALGGSESIVRQKLATGQWVRVYRAVYRDTVVPKTGIQALRAAYLATVGHGVVSHRSAAWLWGFLRHPPARPELSVRAGTRDIRLNGVTIHRSCDLDPTHASHRSGIPVTNPLRTLVDMASEVSAAQLTEAVDIALASKLVTIAGLVAEIERLSRHGRSGVDALRNHLVQRGFMGAPAPSVLEAKMRRIVVSLPLPLPDVEVRAGEHGQYRLDIAWQAILFAIEVDGFVYHSSPEAKQHDEDRRDALRRHGWYIKVYDWRRVCREPAKVGSEIVAIYAQLSAAGPDKPDTD